MQFLNIRTPRLYIRNLCPNDIEDFHSYRSNPEVTKYQGFDVMTQEEAAAFIAAQTGKLFGRPGEWVQYGIENRNTGGIIGDCAIKLQEDDPRIAGIGIPIFSLASTEGIC